jgi:hypothetical protein
MGVAMMRVAERLGPDENPEDLAYDALEVAIAGLKSGVTLRAGKSHCALDPDSERDVARETGTFPQSGVDR